MAEVREHQVVVTAWFDRAAPGRSVESLIQAFEDGFAALWRRALLTLGEVTLTAVVERVLYTATEQFPMLAPIQVEASGLRCQGLRSQAGLRYEDLSPATRFVLVEFLTVLGSLTAQILTPALHAELSKGPSTAKATEDEAS